MNFPVVENKVIYGPGRRLTLSELSVHLKSPPSTVSTFLTRYSVPSTGIGGSEEYLCDDVETARSQHEKEGCPGPSEMRKEIKTLGKKGLPSDSDP